MTHAASTPRPGAPRGLAWILLGALAFTGCGGKSDLAAVYRAEKAYYEAGRAETEARLRGAKPDSSELLALRARFLRVRSMVSVPPSVPDSGAARERALSVLRAVGAAEAAAVRLALEARRPDLALESSQRLRKEVVADTTSSRQAAFMTVAAYQGLRRYEDAIAEMKRILATFPPTGATSGGEDPVLAVPEAIVSLRRNLGDEAGAQRELRDGLAYYQGLLTKPRAPEVEALIRARVLRNQLELKQPGAALEEVNRLEHLVISTPSLKPMLAEVAYAKGMVKAMIDRDPSDGIAILDRVAVDFPGSKFAPRALLQAGTSAESRGQNEGAKARYETILQRFRDSREAPMALLRLGIVQDKMEDWLLAKATIESVPIKYPQSLAAADAPMAVIAHYMRENRKTVAQLYVPRALETYRTLVDNDSSGQLAPVFRTRMLQLYLANSDSLGIYRIVDEQVRTDPKHPFSAQMLLEGARAAGRFGNRSRSAAYLQRFLKEFPLSPMAGDIRRQLKLLGG